MPKISKDKERLNLIAITSTLLLIFILLVVLIFISSSSTIEEYERRVNIWDNFQENEGINTVSIGQELPLKLQIKDFLEFEKLEDCKEPFNCQVQTIKQELNLPTPIYLKLFVNSNQDEMFDILADEKLYYIDISQFENITTNINTEDSKVRFYGLTSEYLEKLEFCINDLNVCGYVYLGDNQNINEYNYRKFVAQVSEMLNNINFTRAN